MKPPIREGPQGGKYQPEPRTKSKQRRLLADKKVQTGPKGGKFQVYSRSKKRYLLHKD